MATHRRLFHHVGIIHIVHFSHAAGGMPLFKVTAQQFELLARRPGTASTDLQIRIALDDLTLRCVGNELFGKDAHRDARLAVDTTGPIGDILAASKTDAPKRFVQFTGMWPVQLGEDLALRFAR